MHADQENRDQDGDWEWRFMKTKKKPGSDKHYSIPPKEPDVDVKGLRSLCEKYAKVADHIAHKRSKLGKRFAFVRFLRVSNVPKLEKRLSSFWIGNFHIFASVARFSRGDTSGGTLNGKDGKVLVAICAPFLHTF
ncbi:unnamed protein product [Lactuca virosa]|uniref:RRM domain-containing protein n=1 Tax=Lactuca virosa TaxID=75947 RepID=A0AAU9M4H6_9ASTR|nr:unnamed protein product [Lactuca virosa]